MSKVEDQDDLMTLAEAAVELRVSHEQVRALCIAGVLPCVPVSKPKAQRLHRRIRRGTLMEFKRNERVPAADAQLQQISSVARKFSSVEQVW